MRTVLSMRTVRTMRAVREAWWVCGSWSSQSQSQSQNQNPRLTRPTIQDTSPEAMRRKACSNTSTGWPPEIKCLSLMTMAGTERMPAWA